MALFYETRATTQATRDEFGVARASFKSIKPTATENSKEDYIHNGTAWLAFLAGPFESPAFERSRLLSPPPSPTLLKRRAKHSQQHGEPKATEATKMAV